MSLVSRSMLRRLTGGLVMVAQIAVSAIAHADPSSLPPRSVWQASTSSVETPAMAALFAIDGDVTTRWGGGFSPGQWFQVDLGSAVEVGGVLIRWDSGFPRAYRIQDSLDGRTWHAAFETTDSPGATDYVFFPSVTARFLRLASPDRTADWGVSMFEFEPLAAKDSPRIDGLGGSADSAAVWSAGGGPRTVGAPDSGAGTERDLHIVLPRPLPIAGLQVFWNTAPRSAKLKVRDASGRWDTWVDDPLQPGAESYLAARKERTVSELRLVARGDAATAPTLDRLRLLSPARVLTPMKRYQVAASRDRRDLFPSSLHQQQVYWTVVGVPACRQKSVLDEYGDIEAFKGAPLVQPVWRSAAGAAAAAYTADLTHSLREGWMPMPAVAWSPQAGLRLRSEAIAISQGDAPVTLVRHRLSNTGATPVDGRLALIVRPIQVSPPWQNGGLASIRDIDVARSENSAQVRVNGRLLLESLTPADAAGAAPFGINGESEITAVVAAGAVPAASSAHDDDGLAAGVLDYSVHLEPGAHRDIVIALPLGNARFDPEAVRLPDAPPLDARALIGESGDAGSGFDTLAAQVAQQWQARVGGIGLSLPDHSLVDMLRAQAAYMLINQTGPAMQPGPRNYNRSFIRDGSATAAVLLRMGMATTARDYLAWYTQHAVHANGLVSPILNDDGTVNTGFGSDIEYDSQGQFVWLVAEIARLDGGAGSVRDYRSRVRSALTFLQELRERTLVPGYMAGREAPARFHGIIAPSISHEGYSTPTHSYWDDYWALKGWHDGAWLAGQWGDRPMETWAREQYTLLRASVAASIRATMQWKGSDTIPAAADLGDGDPTGVSIALDPTGQQDLLPADALQRTFARYLDDVRKRDTPGALYAYTPYEMRNVLTYMHLDQPAAADELLMNLLRHRRPAEWQVLAEVVYSDLRHPIYLGDMPHTWIGSEYARALFGMLMHEGDDRLQLLPGAPPSWVAGEGLALTGLPTAYGKLTMTARRQGGRLQVSLGAGLRSTTALDVSWPSRERPLHVTVDGKPVTDYSERGVRLDRPFTTLTAEW